MIEKPISNKSCKNIPDYLYAFQPHLVAPTDRCSALQKTIESNETTIARKRQDKTSHNPKIFWKSGIISSDPLLTAVGVANHSLNCNVETIIDTNEGSKKAGCRGPVQTCFWKDHWCGVLLEDS